MRQVLAVLVVGLGLLWLVLRLAEPAAAASSCSVPAAWGQLRGAVYSTNIGAFNAAYLYLEASDGTIRAVRGDNCKEVGTITRTP